MAFKKNFFGGRIESDKGFSIQTIGRSGIIYDEGPLRLTVSCEFMVGGDVYLVLYSSSIKHWDKPNDGITISDNKKKEIIDNIVEAFQYCGRKIDIE